MQDARAIIDGLDLKPHPEGGWYRETWREPAVTGARAQATGILFLLEAGQRSHWHRVDAAEFWIFNAGDPLKLLGAGGEAGEVAVEPVVLGSDVEAGQVIQHLYPAGRWQSAEPLGRWTLVTCIVAPGFEFSGSELAPTGWNPPSLQD
ncbi:cupin domain-containing protein [Croceicoccus bisphenolivorans]|uniref:cupin domain-containing protein n=1 Tax=Croceicoccus bisphenolivorans TaxID=1783232 RepID=UPI00082DF420|nr:cupin domain-containing protein [Croceicoccus bisphenolivorans]